MGCTLVHNMNIPCGSMIPDQHPACKCLNIDSSLQRLTTVQVSIGNFVFFLAMSMPSTVMPATLLSH